MVDSLWAALALVLVVDGLLPLIAPRFWRESFRKFTLLTDGQLRFVGLLSIAVGIVGYLLVRHA